MAMTRKPKLKYYLRSRLNDQEPWSAPDVFDTRKARDEAAAMARIYGGIRTHSYEEREREVTPA
jgi:hypothetical protein